MSAKRWAVRSALVLLLGALLLAAAFVLLLPRFLESAWLRTHVEASMHRATGRSLDWTRPRIGWNPLQLRLEEARVGGREAEDPPLLEAAALELRPRLASVWARAFDADAPLVVDLLLEEAHLSVEKFDLRGPLRIRVELEAGAPAPRGSFEIDATDAALDYAGAFRKPPGKPVTIWGRVESADEGRLEVRELGLRIRKLDSREARIPQ